jgi:hypothetical protein
MSELNKYRIQLKYSDHKNRLYGFCVKHHLDVECRLSTVARDNLYLLDIINPSPELVFLVYEFIKKNNLVIIESEE